MKKIFLFLIAILGVVTIVSAQTRYSVTILVQVTYVYYDDNWSEVGRDYMAGTPQTIQIVANTPYEAEKEALQECSTMCQTSCGKNEGKKMYKGKYYNCKSFKEPYSATAKEIKGW